ncbi:MAG: hypothetical protein LBG60_10860 [Bifidobacteriaceae bacterium]|jgi:hypothetical protein|nr:hypothetical protein [Bifidobacteriaceae bacterium]
MSLELAPVSLADARAFIAAWHRHNKPPRRTICQVGCARDGVLVGVATLEWPKGRGNADGRTAEISRCAVADGERNACSMLYRACVRAALALGYTRVITYTRQDESGGSLRGAAFRLVAERPARGDHFQSAGRRRMPNGAEGVARYLWEATA